MLVVFVLTSSLWPLWPEQIMASSLTFSAQPTLAEVIRSRTLAQPLLPMGGTEPSPAEISALAQALATFSKVPANSEDASALESFLAAYPQSAFRVSLLTNLGMMYRQHGYWSNALSAWQQAWQAGKTETDPAKRLVVDQALSHLAELTARIGRIDDLSALFQDAGSRAVRGPSAERYSMAKESLFLMQTKPTKSYRCGPFAVGQVLQALHPERSLGKEMHDSVSTDHGTSLTMVRDFAQKLGLNYQLAFRNPGAAVLVPSVVNWKVGHFAALTQEVSDRYLVKDPTFTDNFGVSTRALDQEASGYFLVRSGSLPPGWRTVTDQEGQKVWGRGAVPNNTAGTPPCTSPSSCSGMAVHNVDLARVNLFLDDTPLFYTPPRGPAVELMATYSQRDIPPVSLTNFPNLGVAWNLNWVAFIVDNPNNTTSYGPGGGTLNYTNYNSSTQAFAPQVQTQAILQRVTTTAPAYEYVRTFPDGSRQVFNFTRVFNGTTYFFMTESDDPAGNSIQYNYDASTGRLTSVTDAMGLITAITYNETDSSQPDYFTINSVKDPYNRTANFSYNALGQLLTITDMASLTSSFTYNANDAIIKLTTPYGATIFDEQDQGETRSMLITDPEGGKEQIMYVGEGVTPPDPNPTLPSGTGMTFNSAWQEENTYYWNKQAYAVGAGDYTKAHLYHWLLLPGSAQMSDVPSDEKPALESRIFYNYAGQSSSNIIGASNQPTAVARVLDGGATQLAQYAYNPQGRMTEAVTPGNSTTPARTTTYWYAQNGIDLTAVYQWNPHGSTTDPSGAQADLLRSMTYNAQHEVLSATDAAQEPSSYVYNAYGQLLSFTNAKQQTTTYTYDRDQEGGNGVTDGFLLTVTRPAPNATTAFTYGSYGLVASVEDSDGYTVGINYDLLNRITKRSYPDHSYEEIDYDRLDPQWQRDRLGRWTQMLYDAERHLTVVIDPLSRITQYDWCSCGSLEAITDANGNKTTWMRDAESRVTAKVYADGRVWGTTYEPSTSRVSYTNDPKGQYTIYGYNVDNSVASVKYASDASGTALSPPTPGVTYAYDPAYPRLLTMQDGIGTTTYTYNPVPAPSTPTRGGGRLASEAGPFANSTITYGYDELGRLAGQSVSDYTVPTSFGYDTLGRLNQVTNQLDTFTYGYVDNTNRLNSVTSKYGPATQYAYYGGNNDPRLQTLTNSTAGGPVSQFGYTYSAVGDILSWTQSNSGGGDAQQYGFGYDADSELTSATLQDTVTGSTLSALAYAYDAAGNRVSVQNGGSVTTETPNNLNQLTGTSGGGLARFAGTVSVSSTPSGNHLASVSVGGNAATVRADGSYEGWAPVSGTGTTSVAIVATDSNNVSTTRHASVPAGSVAGQQFGYDKDGNQTAVGPSGGSPTATYGWDALNRLISITQGSNVTTFDYDGQSRRVRESLNGTEVRHWVWIGTTLAEERNAANAVTKRFFAQGEQIAGQNYYYTRDHLGSVRELVDGAGAVRARYSYDPYGVRSTNQITSNPVEADFGFTGHYFHQASGLHLAPYRAYNTQIGRWISRDPIGESGGINLYSYVVNRPISFRDPSGLFGIGTIVSGSIEEGGLPQQTGRTSAPDIGATGSVGAGVFDPSLGNLIANLFSTGDPGTTGGTFRSGGAFMNNKSAVASPSGKCPWAKGLSAGIGAGIFATNARNVSDLQGPFDNLNVNTPWFSIQLSWGSASDGSHIGMVSVTAGGGLGASVSSYATNTVTSSPSNMSDTGGE